MPPWLRRTLTIGLMIFGPWAGYIFGVHQHCASDTSELPQRPVASARAVPYYDGDNNADALLVLRAEVTRALAQMDATTAKIEQLCPQASTTDEEPE